jgi:hypothetical protein
MIHTIEWITLYSVQNGCLVRIKQKRKYCGIFPDQHVSLLTPNPFVKFAENPLMNSIPCFPAAENSTT